MQITSVTVGWSETCSLPGYNNVHPSVTMTATVDAGEDANVVIGILMGLCKEHVQAEVDIALRRRGCRSQYAPPEFGQTIPALEKLEPWQEREGISIDEDDEDDEEDYQ